MGRSYYVEEAVEKYFYKLIQQQQKGFITGLIIGQSSPQREFVLLAAQTPHKEDQREGNTVKPALSKLDEIDEDWVSSHASQVSRMLPGGLLVLGVFLITSPELSKDSQNALRKLIFAVEKSSMKNRLWSFDDNDVCDRAALHICSATKKITCRTFDVKDPKSTAKPADWKYQSSTLSWLTIDCNVCVDLTVPRLSAASSYQEQQKCTRAGLAKWAKEIDDVTLIFNGRVKDIDGDLLDEHKKSSRSSSFSNSQTITANILRPCLTNNDSRSTALVQVCKSSVTFKGIVRCRAYVHTNKPKVRDAVQVLKRDLLDTVSNRCEILFEDLLLNGPQNDDEQELCLLPQRVFVPIAGTNVTLCDYAFGDETAEDLHQRFLEMLDQDVQSDGLVFAEEKYTETNNEEKLATDIPCLENLKIDQPDTSKKNPASLRSSHRMSILIAVVVAVLAALFSFQYLLE